MPGLREKKKTARRQRILTAAKMLFKKHGYASTTIDVIAAHANVSSATVYNYYQTKGDLLLALVAEGDQEVIKRAHEILNNPPDQPYDAIYTLLTTFTEMSLHHIDRQTWRRVLANTLIKSRSGVGRRILELNREFCNQLVVLLTTLRDSGQIDLSVDITAAAEVLFNSNHALFTELVTDDSMALHTYKAKLGRYIPIVLSSLHTTPSSTADPGG